MCDQNSKVKCVWGWREEVTWLSKIDGLKIISGQGIVVMGFIGETEYRCLKLATLCKEALWKGLNILCHSISTCNNFF